MDFQSINRNNLILFLIVLGFSIMGLWIRLLPLEFLLGSAQPIVISTDPWYTVRQVEQILPHFPAYSWFDPLLSYPNGKVVDWGPVFPLLSSAIALLSGASTQNDIIQAISWVPVVLGMLLIPVGYLLGKITWNSRAGLISAMLVSVAGGLTIFRSFYGSTDHHILEVVLTAGFFLLYFSLLRGLHKNDNQEHVADNPTEKSISAAIKACQKEIYISIGGGFVYYLAIMTMPTCTLIAVTVLIITFLLSCVLTRKSDYFQLFLFNGLIFTLFIVLYGLTGIHVAGWSLGQYTAIHLLLPVLIVTASCILYFLSILVKDSGRIVFPAVLVVFFGIISCVVYLGFQFISSSFVHTIITFFGGGGTNVTIQEMQAANTSLILGNYNLISILAIIGFIFVIFRYAKTREPVLLGMLTWSVIYLGIGLLVFRYFYYGGFILLLLSSICLDGLFERLHGFGAEKSSKWNKGHKDPDNIKKFSGYIVVALIIGVITVFSIQSALFVTSKDIPGTSVNDELIETLHWLKNVPSGSNLDYYAQYERDSFTYRPNTSTVISWWNQGHWILALTHLIPATSPFQDQVSTVAQYLLSGSNEKIEKIGDKLHGKYIITSNEMLLDDFPLIQNWIPKESTDDLFYFIFYRHDQKNQQRLNPVIGLKPSFYNTTIVRLHVNDGSYTKANESFLVTYRSTSMNGKNVPVLLNLRSINQSSITQVLRQKQQGQEIVGISYTSPITDTPALEHYRLIYESNGTRDFPGNVTLSNIKIFERVIGYTIPGAGTIEVPIITNQGREFTYRQQSVDNTFTLPYATTNSPYDVRATGPYRIIETNKTFDVDESQIEKYYT